MDIVTFFYSKTMSYNTYKLEKAVVDKIMKARSLPPTIDILIPKYVIISVDLYGQRLSEYLPNTQWNTLERATVFAMKAFDEAIDYSKIITYIEDGSFDAVILVSSLIPLGHVSVIDSVSTHYRFKGVKGLDDIVSKFISVANVIKGNITIPVHSICEVDSKKQYYYQYETRCAIPEGWHAAFCPSFGFTSAFICSNEYQSRLLNQFRDKYVTEVWTNKQVNMNYHQFFTGALLCTCISSTIVPTSLSLPARLCVART